MVDYKEVKNPVSLKADEATREELDILEHQNVNETITIGDHGVAQADIKYQMEKTFVFPIPTGKPLVLNGYVSPDDVKEFYVAKLNPQSDRPKVSDAEAKS